jgi:hypothetical protein
MPTVAHSPMLPTFADTRDRQVDALLAVFEANLEAAVGPHIDGGRAVREAVDWPVTIHTVGSLKLPALSVFAETAQHHQEGKKKQLRRSFRAVWWHEHCAYDRIAKPWRHLRMVFETIHATLNGQALYALDEPGIEKPRVGPLDVLGGAGFRSVVVDSIASAFNFVQHTQMAQAYPLVQVTFVATHESTRGPYVYDPSTLPPLKAFAASILEAQRRPEEQPAVKVLAEKPQPPEET